MIRILVALCLFSNFANAWLIFDESDNFTPEFQKYLQNCNTSQELVGYFHGTFDPPHVGHEGIIKSALGVEIHMADPLVAAASGAQVATKKINCVVISASGGYEPSKPGRLDPKLRIEMLSAIYSQRENVFVMNREEIPLISKALRELESREIKVAALCGEDWGYKAVGEDEQVAVAGTRWMLKQPGTLQPDALAAYYKTPYLERHSTEDGRAFGRVVCQEESGIVDTRYLLIFRRPVGDGGASKIADNFPIEGSLPYTIGRRYRIMPPTLNVSSTKIRQAIKGGEIPGDLSPSVFQVIQSHSLYR